MNFATKKTILFLLIVAMSPVIIVGFFARFLQAAFLNGLKAYDAFANWLEGG